MKTVALAYLLVVSFACKFSSSTQQKVTNPIEDIAWIKAYIEETTKSPFPTKAMITQYTYNNETVYLVDGCHQCPDAPSFLYNAKKETLCIFGGMIANTNNCPDFLEKATDETLLWKSF